LVLEGPLAYLTYIGIILLIGIICTVISNKLKMPNILFLIIAGLLLGWIPYKGQPIISFPDLFITSISTLALVMIVFDSSSKFKLSMLKAYSLPILNLSFTFLIVNLVALSFFALLLFREMNLIWYALVFAAIMSGTDPGAVLMMFKGSANRVLQVLEFESVINTPITVLIPFIILEMYKNFGSEIIVSQFISQIGPFLQQVVSGIGAGILVGIIVFKFMRKQYSETLSPLALITAALLTYIIAENLKGNGVLAVTVMGVFFGNLYIKEKEHLIEFSSLFANALEILVFVLVGLVIKAPFTISYLWRALVLFIIYLILRYIAIAFAMRNYNYSFKHKIFMALNVQKGIATAVVVLALSTLGIPELKSVVDLSLMFMIYSIILSTVVGKFSGFFLDISPRSLIAKVKS